MANREKMADRFIADGANIGEELKRLYVVTRRLGVDEVAKWAKQEAWGYKEDAEVPSYRMWRTALVGTLHNPFQAIMNEVSLPDMVLHKDIREKALTFKCTNGVGQICIELATIGSKSSTFRTTQSNLTALINSQQGEEGGINEGWSCTHARAEFPRGRLLRVVEEAQKTATEFCMECEEKDIVLRHTREGETNEGWMKAINAAKVEMAKQIGREVIGGLFGTG